MKKPSSNFLKLAPQCAALLFAAQTANAELQGFGDAEGWLLGVGVVAETSPFEQAKDSTSITPFPYFAYEWENAHAGIDGFAYTFLGSDHFDMEFLIEPRWSLASPDDSPLFTDLDRDAALESGLATKLKVGPLYLATQALFDVSDTHEGYEGRVELGFELEIGALQIDLSGGAVYRNNNLSQHLYGVSADEAKPELPAYTVGETTQPFIGADFTLVLGDRTAIIGYTRYEAFDDEAKKSPLISEKGETSIGFALLRLF